MKELNFFKNSYCSTFLVIAVTIIISITFTLPVIAQNPNSDTTSTGQILTIHITSPSDSTILNNPPFETAVSGVVTLSQLLTENVNVMYVLDISGSTGEGGLVPDSVARIDVNGDGVVDSGDDFNNDGHIGDILDAEIGGVLSLNESLGNLSGVDMGIIGFAHNAMNADVKPEAGMQYTTSSPGADLNNNGIPDLEEVLRSMDSNERDLPWGGSIDLFTHLGEAVFGYKTNFERAMQRIIFAFQDQPAGEKKIAFLLSNGFKTEGGEVDDEIVEAIAAGITINTFGISVFADTSYLRQIAEGTGGIYVRVLNPSEITTILPGITPVGLSKVIVNDQEVTPSAIGTFSIDVSFDSPGTHTIEATAIADDRTTVTAIITVICQSQANLVSDCEIISPQDSAIVCDDSVAVTGNHIVAGGFPPYTKTCEVNGILADYVGDTFQAKVPLSTGENSLVATCTVVDSSGNSVVCRDTVSVVRVELPTCEIQITSPGDSAIVCDSAEVVAELKITGGMPPYVITTTINGIKPAVYGDILMATVPLTSGYNSIVAAGTATDSCGNISICKDSITVMLDDILPTSNFTQDEQGVTGTIVDNESGIDSIVPLYISGGFLDIDPFTPGEKTVNFRIVRDEPGASIGFDLQVTDGCGNVFICDPIMQMLATEGVSAFQQFTFSNIDRYFQLNNHGLSRVDVELNGAKFSLVTDPAAVDQYTNGYLMPAEGTVCIDMQAHVLAMNTMTIEAHGFPGTIAELMISNFSSGVDYILELQPELPANFALSQNYPNPFNPGTEITFDIPSTSTEDVPVQLMIYNLLGQMVRVLVAEPKPAGHYLVRWNGKNELGENVPSGVYFYVMVAGDFKGYKKMTLIR